MPIQVKDTSRKFNLRGGDIAVYEIADEDTSGSTEYFGFVNADGAWIIQEINRSSSPATYRYIGGTSAYPTAFTNRESLEYDYYYEMFPSPV